MIVTKLSCRHTTYVTAHLCRDKKYCTNLMYRIEYWDQYYVPLKVLYFVEIHCKQYLKE